MQGNLTNEWHIYNVTTDKWTKGPVSVAVDKESIPHLLYYVSARPDIIVVAHWEEDHWVEETIETAGLNEHFMSSPTSLAVDADDTVHIGYYKNDHVKDESSLMYGSKYNGTWALQTVESGDPSSYFGSDSSLALDHNNYPRITYKGGYDIRYAAWNGIFWEIQEVEYLIGIDGPTSLALDSKGYPHVTYINWVGDKTDRYAHWDGAKFNVRTLPQLSFTSEIAIGFDDIPQLITAGTGSGPGPSIRPLVYLRLVNDTWEKKTLFPARAYGMGSSLALDSLGHPHVAYYSDGPTLNHAWWTGMYWITETVGLHNPTSGLSLTLGPDDIPYIAWVEDWSNTVRLATTRNLTRDLPPVADAGPDQMVNEGDTVQFDGSGSYDPDGDWVNITLDSADDVGKHVSIAIDGNDNPHIAYKDDTNDYVKYAHYSGGAWNFEMVDAIGKGEEQISLALDVNDRPHISYFDSNDDILKYARWTGLTWETEVVDSTPGSGFWNSMALDSKDWPHISYYYGYPGRSLKYARWNGSSWETETVDSSADYVGWYNSIAVDSNDRPHISYRDETNEDLKYARWTGSSWSIEAVDTVGRKGLQTSIALDSYDRPHISYADTTDWTLRYATWTGSVWNIEVADSVDHVGYQSSIVLDSHDNPHISYNDFTNQTLRYAKRTGGSWNVERVDIEHNVMWETSIALDSVDNPHITYTNWGVVNYDLKYASKRGGIVSYEWDFDASIDSDGDGNHTNDVDATGPTPTNVYDDDGVYTVTLKITDNSGLWDTDITIITVLNLPPVADAGGPYIGFEGTPVVVTGNHTDAGSLDTHTYEWDFSYDGTTFIPDATGNPYQKTWYDDYTGTIALRVTDDDGGWDIDVTTVTIRNVPPRADAGDDKEGFEVSTFTFNGDFYDPGTGDTHTFEWDFDYDGINFDVEATGQSVSHTFVDDFDGEVAVRVTDDDGGVDIDTSHVLVKNVPPTVTLEVLPIEVDAFVRIAGEKWHDVSIELFEDGVLIANGTLVRYPGSPNDQMLSLSALQFNYSRNYTAIVRYTPDDDPVNGQPNGANPCWIILRFSDSQELWLHHTFNVQHQETYVWEVDLTAAILSHGMTFKATAFDSGADDLTFYWNFGDGTILTSFYPNAVGTYPVEIIVAVDHAFPGSGTYVVVLTIEDDDGGVGSASLTIFIP